MHNMYIVNLYNMWNYRLVKYARYTLFRHSYRSTVFFSMVFK
jgi:hypothetical protein